MDDDQLPPRSERFSASKLSKTPSWIMLGFVLGALFVVALPPLRKKTPAVVEPRRVEFMKPAAPRQPQPLSTIEAVFEEWGGHAIWFDDITEVALWNSAEREFVDYYEVRRVRDTYYFRTIPRLTRRVLSHGTINPESPLRFTETDEQYREWLERGRIDRSVDLRLRPAIDLPGKPARPTGTTMPIPPVAPPRVNPADIAPPAAPDGK